MGFRKTALVEPLATYLSAANGWKKTARARGMSHFAQMDYRSIQEILNGVWDRYAISKDPKDYIFAAYRAVTENIPNGNGDMFPREELLSWNKYERKPVYQTFEFKPNHVNHQADNPKLARGVVVDVHYNESNPEDRFVEVLIAIDTKKDPLLAKGVLESILTDCSMGCDSLRTECNVCDNVAFSPADYCVHIKNQKMKMCKAPDGSMKLSFERCYEVTFQEISIVDDPADKTAEQQEVLTVDEIPSDKIASQTAVLDLKARVKRLEGLSRSQAAFGLAAFQNKGDSMSVGIQGKTAQEEKDAPKAEGKEENKEAIVTAPKQAKKSPDSPLPEHHHLAAIYAKHHMLAFENPHYAMQAAMKESGKSEEEMRQAWSKKMAEEVPHPLTADVAMSLNAQLAACGDLKKAVKRTAKDMDMDPDLVEKVADFMKRCNKMANYSLTNTMDSKQAEKELEMAPKASAEAPKEEKKEAAEEPKEAPKEEKKAAESPKEPEKKAAEAPKEEDKKEAAEAPPIPTNLPGSPGDAPIEMETPQQLSDKIAQSAKLAAQRLTAQEKEEEPMKNAQAEKYEGKKDEKKDAQFGEPVAPGAQSELSNSQKALEGQHPMTDKKAQAEAPKVENKKDEKKASDEPKAEEKKAAEEPKDEKKDAQKVMSDKTREQERKEEHALMEAKGAKKAAEGPKKEEDKKDEKEAQKSMPSSADKPAGDGTPLKAEDKADVAQTEDSPNKKSLADMGIKTSKKKGNQFPFAKFYGDVTAREMRDGEIHLLRAKKTIMTIPPGRTSPTAAMKLVAQIGLIGAMKKLGGMQKKADAGVQEGAVTDAKGAYGPSPQSSQEGSVTDMRDSRSVNPASSTAGGAITDEKDKYETKSIFNSNVREQAVSDAKGGYEVSSNETIGAEHPDMRERHKPKNVGTDNVLSQRQTDMVLKGLDPRSAALVKERLASLKLASEEDDKEKEKEAKQAKDEKDKKEEIEKKAALLAAAKMEKFKRAMRIAARRFALNIEPCDLKYNLGSILSTRHEASNFEGIDDPGLVYDLVERGFNMNAAMEKTVAHMVRRAEEMSAMPEDSLKAIEADASHLEPIHPSAMGHHGEEEGDAQEKSAMLRRRASLGSLPQIRPAVGASDPVIPSKSEVVRSAMGAGVLSRYGR